MALTALSLTVPSLSFPLLSVLTLHFSWVLPGGSAQKGPSEAGVSYTQPHSPSTFLSASFPPSFLLLFFPHSIIQGLTFH